MTCAPKTCAPVKGDAPEPAPAEEGAAPATDDVAPPAPTEASVHQIFHQVSYRRW
jgi:hypothetical protein